MTEFVYALQEDDLIILPRDVAEGQARLVDLTSCDTWGELRAKATPEQFEEILGLAGYGSFEEYTQHLAVGRPLPGVYDTAAETYDDLDGEMPTDDSPFLLSRISAYGDGDWPPDARFLTAESLPSEVVEECGDYYEAIFNGTPASKASSWARQ